MTYRMKRHGVGMSNDRRTLTASCASPGCGWKRNLAVKDSQDTKPFYRVAKEHVEEEHHVVAFEHIHTVIYHPIKPWK